MRDTVSGWVVKTRLREKRRARQTERGNSRGAVYSIKQRAVSSTFSRIWYDRTKATVNRKPTLHCNQIGCGVIFWTYRPRLKGIGQVWWILLLLLLTTSAWACLKHSHNVAEALLPSPVHCTQSAWSAGTTGRWGWGAWRAWLGFPRCEAAQDSPVAVSKSTTTGTTHLRNGGRLETLDQPSTRESSACITVSAAEEQYPCLPERLITLLAGV